LRGDLDGEGLDYRKEPRVFAAAAWIDGTDWLLVSKVDQDELLAAWRRQLFAAAVLSLLLVIATAIALARIWRNQRRVTRARLHEEQHHRQELERLRNDLIETMEVARLGGWERNLISGELWWSDRTRELLGIPPDTAPTAEAFLERVHPDDREQEIGST